MKHIFTLFILNLFIFKNVQAQTDSLLRVEIKTMLDSVEVLYNKQKFEEAGALARAQIQFAEKAFGRVDTLGGTGLVSFGGDSLVKRQLR